MTVTINGTTGIAGTNGSAGTPAVQGEDTNTGIFFPAADTVAVATGGAERLRVDSAGNAGLGVTPSAWSTLYSQKAFQFGPVGSLMSLQASTTNNQTSVNSNAVNLSGGWTYMYSDSATQYRQFAGTHSWSNAPSGTAGNAITFTQAMTLDASGNLLVGMTSVVDAGRMNLSFDNATQRGVVTTSNQTAASDHFLFRNPNGQVGSIRTTNSTTAYNTSSDYRLKENVQPMTGALDTITQLNPVTYTWKVDGLPGQGFIAHELQAVVPDCVTGEKDAVDAEGNPQYQGVDTSFLVATLVKAIQEQQVLLMELTARVAQLEAQ